MRRTYTTQNVKLNSFFPFWVLLLIVGNIKSNLKDIEPISDATMLRVTEAQHYHRNVIKKAKIHSDTELCQSRGSDNIQAARHFHKFHNPSGPHLNIDFIVSA